MRRSTSVRASVLLASVSLSSAMLAAAPAAAQTDAGRISVPAMPLDQALKAIAERSGVAIALDPDIDRAVRSRPVRNATSAREAVQTAIAGTGLSVDDNASGGLMVVRDIVVRAVRDEAETGYLVRSTSTSSRLGESLREQPRNTQVIGARTLAEQQAQTIPDALRNAGGVSVNTATVQGGTAYSVRGFSSGGVVNGLPGAANGGVATGVSQSVANVERVEVLKGPDALLAGIGNLGGAVNVVTKKPSADPYLYVSAETGSFGHIRGSVDATSAINDARTVSARVIATAADDKRNYGGYRGNGDYLFAPSIRFKTADTDITAGVTASSQTFGLQPFVPLNPATNRPFVYPRDRPIASRDQFLKVSSTQIYGEATQKVTDWLTLVARGQHEKLGLDINYYGIAFVAAANGTLGLFNSGSRQTGDANAVDTFARIKVNTGPIEHTLVGGYTYVHNVTQAFSSSRQDLLFYNFLTATAPLPPLLLPDTTDYTTTSSQNGYYGQWSAKFGGLRLIAGVRHNDYSTAIAYPTRAGRSNASGATTPNFGAVYDVTGNLSLFASYARGYFPTFTLDRNAEKLPDVRTRNIEGGLKFDMFHDRLFLTASYFELRQSNLIITDPTNTRFSIAVPGQEGKGIDLNLTGEILKGWQVQGSFTRTEYAYLTPSTFGNVVIAQPRDQYSLYSSYRHALGGAVTGGLGAGIYGRSSASINRRGTYYVDPARQVDLNAFLKIGALDVNLGVRNLFDRTNFGITAASSFIPYQEPRNWRLTVGYRFK